MLLELLPAQLYGLPNIHLLFRHNGSSIMHKRLSDNLIDKEIYLSSVAILYIVQGRQIIKSYEGKKITVEQGELVYLSQDMYLVSDFVTDNGEFEAILFFFDDELFVLTHKIVHSLKRIMFLAQLYWYVFRLSISWRHY